MTNNETVDTVEIKPVQICTVKAKKVLYKDGEPAERIEQIVLEENDFTLVAQKDLYEVGSKVFYIQPDFNLPDSELFDGFIRPFGDPKKSILGSHNRIRAKKFSFLTEEGNIIYSIGIMLPIEDVKKFHPKIDLNKDLAEQIGVYKRPSDEGSNGSSGKVNGGYEFPSGFYKTDETNILNVVKRMEFPKRYIGSLKADGSSITLFYENEFKKGVVSRSLVRPFKIKKNKGLRKPTFFEKIKKFFGYKVDLREFDMVENDDKFLTLGKPYFDKIEEYCFQNHIQLAFRGEAYGSRWGGSGNKNNPHFNKEEGILFFGVDKIDSGITLKLGDADFKRITDDLGFERVPLVFDQVFETKEELFGMCDTYFKTNLIEGIVIRDEDSKFSAKYMNPEYDSKK